MQAVVPGFPRETGSYKKSNRAILEHCAKQKMSATQTKEDIEGNLEF